MKSRVRPLARSELEEYARDIVVKVVAELREHGELLTVTYVLTDDDLVLLPTFYRTPLEKDVCVLSLRLVEKRLRSRATFYVARAWVSEAEDGEGSGRSPASNGCDLKVVTYGPGERPPVGSRQAFCVLATSSVASVALVTPYRTDSSSGRLRLEVGRTFVTDVTL